MKRLLISILLPFLLVAKLAQAQTATLTTNTTSYAPGGGQVVLTATINYSTVAAPTALGFTINIPAGWTLVSTGGPNVPGVVPDPGTTGVLEYAYTSFPANSATFTATVSYPASETGNKSITSSALYRTPQTNLTPAAITIVPVVTAVQSVASKTVDAGSAVSSFTPVTAAGGMAPFTYVISPALANGLSFSTSTGAITGTPSAAASATNYTVTITDSATPQGSANNTFSLTVSPALTSAVAVATKGLTVNTAAAAFTPVTAAGGTNPKTFAITPALPAGLSLNTATGEITGTPTATAAATDYTVTITDGASVSTSKTFNLTVNSALGASLVIANRTLSAGTAASAFTPVTASGGTLPYTFGTGPTLPAGLSINSSTGAISGTPSSALASTSFFILITDAAGATANQQFNLTINGPLIAMQSVPAKSLTAGNGAASQFVPVAAAGGTAPYTYSIAPSLPSALNFNTSTGAVSGTPAAAAAATTYTVTITDSASAVATNTFSLTINAAIGATQAIAAKSLTVGTAAVAFTPVTPTAGTPPYVAYTITPALPTGLSISSSTGAITGTPSVAAAIASYSVKITDVNGAQATNSFDLTVNVAPSANQTIASKTLTAGSAATPFTPLTVTGGTVPFGFSISPALPAGLSISASTGAISGTPGASAAAANYSVTATDSAGAQVTHVLNLLVNPALAATQAIASKTLNAGAAATPFTPVTASGGTTPYSFAVNPALPGGLSINGTTGEISGTPAAAAAAASYTITVTDSTNATASRTFNLTVNGPLVANQAIASKAVTAGAAITAFTPVAGGGGTAPYTYSISPALPAGVVLNASTGAITGNASAAAATVTYTVTVTDSVAVSISNTFSLTVNPALTTAQAVAAKGLTLGTAVVCTPVTAADGTTPYTFAISPALPAGLSFNTASGEFTGTPTAVAAAATYTVTVTDSGGASSSKTFSLTVNPALSAVAGQTIASKTLTATTAAVAFTPLPVSGGTLPITYSVNPSLPSGLNLNINTGAISGTAAGELASTPFTITATDAAGATVTQTLTLVVNPALVATQVVASVLLTTNAAATPVTPVTRTGGTAPFTFAINPGLPAGVSLASGTGVISGTPTAASISTSYTITVTDAVGATMGQSFLLGVHAPAAITTQPVAVAKNVGQSAQFTVVATGNPAPTYQWKKGGADLAGKTDATLTLGSLTLDDAGNYSVEVRNTTVNGSTSTPNVVLSSSVALTVSQPPTISAQPQSQTVLVSASSVSFSVTASGTPTPTYQWKKNGADIAGATATTLTVSNLSLALSGSKYSVVVTNAAGGVGGTVTSDEATLTVNPVAPVIASIPATTFTGVQGSTLLYGPIVVNANAAPYTFSATGLPAGLTINPTNGNISGTPTASTGGATVTITVTNVTGSDSRTVTFIIQPPVPSFSAAIIPTQATVATAYSFALTGVQNATSFSATGLPPGLTINTSSGLITGTPTTAGVYTAQLTATNVTGSTPVSIVFNVVLPPGAPAYVGTLTPSGKVGVAFSFTPDFGTGTTTYAITGTLPAGLGFSTSTGAITGTPTVAGSFPISIAATRSGITATAALTLTINPPDAAPAVVFPAAGNAISLTLNTPITTTFSSGYQLAANPVAGSGQTVTFAATGLPAGLSLGASGALTGTPTVLGTFNAVVSATNSVTGKGPDATLRIFVDPSPLAPVISSAAAVLGRVNEALTPTYQLTATPAATSFALVTTGLPAGISATLPAGLTLSGSTISGTPTAAGVTHVLIVGTNGSGTGAPQEIVFTIRPPLTVPVVNSNGSASGNVGQAFSYQITATNSPTGYGLTGSLPAGLSFTAGSGIIFGVPSAPTAAPVVVNLTASNGDGTSEPKPLSITIGAALATPVIANPGATVSGRVGVALTTYTITASESPTSFSAIGLPPGLVLAPATGAISGTPTQSGSFATQVSATNAAGTGAAATLNFVIAAAAQAPTIGGAAPSAGRVGVAFDYQIVATVSAGSPAVTSYALTGAGTLPVGLTLNTSSGRISGTPAEAGLFTVNATATNSAGTSAPQPLVINIQPALNTPVITSPITASATVGAAFSYLITATNLTGSAPYAPPIALEAVGLPAGLAGNPATGAIQGTPTTVGSATVTLMATNAAGTGPARTLTLEVLPAPTAPVVNSPVAASAQVAATFSYQITATNGPTSFEVIGAPAWMAVGTGSGTLSGVPVEPGALNVSLVASNSAGASSPRLLTINVAASASAPVITSSQSAGGTAGSPFSYQISATNTPTSFGATGLPAGVTVNTANGAIAGTPTVSGTYAVTIFARNGSGKSYPVTLTLTIAPSVPFSGN